MRSVNEQIEAMRRQWPILRVVHREGRRVVWRGYLRPLLQPYEIEIQYRAPLIIEAINPKWQQPEVRVLSPALKPRRGDPEGEIPHVYWDDPARPFLCLFDPDAREWTPADMLADTTVPWSLDWLACYEGWRATGEWTGGGRHARSGSQGSAA